MVANHTKMRVDVEGHHAKFAMAMRQVRREASATGAHMERSLGRANERVAAQARKSQSALLGVANVSRQGRFVLQNTAAQIGDIAVQLEGGTSAFRVFGQQLPQIFGGFGALGGTLGVLGPLFGTLAAVGLPVAGMFLLSAENAQTLTERIDDLNDELAAYEGAADVAGWSSDKMIEKYGALAEAIRPVLDLQRDLAEASSGAEVTGVSGQIADWGQFYDSPGGFRPSQGVTSFFDVNQMFTFTQAQRELRREADGLGEEFMEIQASIRGAGDNIALQHEAMKQLIDTATKLADLDGQRTDRENEFLGTLAEAVEAQARHLALKERDRQIALGIKADLEQEVALRDAVAKYGAKSVEVTRLRAAAERETLQAQLEGLDVSEALKMEILAAFDAAQQLSTTDVASGIAAGVSQAQALAGWLGVSLQTAQRIASFGDQGVPSRDENGKQYSGRGGDPRNMGGSFYDWKNRDAAEFLSNWKPPKPSAGSGSGGGGGGGGRANEVDRFAQSFANLRGQLDPTWRATQKYEESVRVLSKALELGRIDQEEYNALLAKAEEVYSKAGGGAQGFESALKGLSGDLADVILGFENIGDVANRIFQDMARNLLASGIHQLLESLGSSFGGGGGLFGEILSAAFGGARAQGGSVRAGVPYLVNENTPNSEIYVPSQNGGVLNVPQAQAALRGFARASSFSSSQASPQFTLKNVNILDPALVGDFLATADGEKLVTNIIRRNLDVINA